MENTKITKRMVLEAIKAAATEEIYGDEVTAEDVIAYVDTTIEQMDKKNEKAAERAAAKRAESDELKEAVFAVVTNEPQTRQEIFEALGDDSLTVNKVGSRLTALVNDGRVVKSDVKTEDKRTVKAYALA